jgi:hypothetical protein
MCHKGAIKADRSVHEISVLQAVATPAFTQGRGGGRARARPMTNGQGLRYTEVVVCMGIQMCFEVTKQTPGKLAHACAHEQSTIPCMLRKASMQDTGLL